MAILRYTTQPVPVLAKHPECNHGVRLLYPNLGLVLRLRSVHRPEKTSLTADETLSTTSAKNTINY